MDLGDLLGSLDVNVSADGMADLASGLLEGYQAYAQSHPEADFSGLQEDFLTYLGTDSAKEILRRH